MGVETWNQRMIAGVDVIDLGQADRKAVSNVQVETTAGTYRRSPFRDVGRRIDVCGAGKSPEEWREGVSVILVLHSSQDVTDVGVLTEVAAPVYQDSQIVS